MVDELTEKLLERRIPSDQVTEFLALLAGMAEWVTVPPDAVQPVVSEDPDDDVILACAVVGKADYLVTYDAHFGALADGYAGVRIMKALPFLRALRGES